jgi:hypothetical protein
MVVVCALSSLLSLATQICAICDHPREMAKCILYSFCVREVRRGGEWIVYAYVSPVFHAKGCSVMGMNGYFIGVVKGMDVAMLAEDFSRFRIWLESENDKFVIVLSIFNANLDSGGQRIVFGVDRCFLSRTFH